MAIKLKITNGNYSAEGTSATVKCNGKKLASDIVIECVEVSEVKLISFTINGTQYQAVEGMTWQEWVESEYNTFGYYIEKSIYGTYNVCFGENSYVTHYEYNISCVEEDDLIEADKDYNHMINSNGGSN